MIPRFCATIATRRRSLAREKGEEPLLGVVEVSNLPRQDGANVERGAQRTIGATGLRDELRRFEAIGGRFAVPVHLECARGPQHGRAAALGRQ